MCQTCIVTETADFFKYLCGSWDEAIISLINNQVCFVNVQEDDEFTKHDRRNMYIATF